MSKHQFLVYLADHVRQRGSQKDAAQCWGISAQYLADVLHERREAGPKLLMALGLRREVTYLTTGESAHEE